MTIDELKDFIRIESANKIYKDLLLGDNVWLFEEFMQEPNPVEFYDDFRAFVSTQLEVNFNSIAIIGTAKTGYSLSPNKKFKIFTKDSDIDLVLVSTKKFNEFWDAYLDISTTDTLPSNLGIPKNIFRRFTYVDDLGSSNETLKAWEKKVAPFMKDIQTRFNIFNQINYRVYRGWKDVERYHLKGINELKKILSGGK